MIQENLLIRYTRYVTKYKTKEPQLEEISFNFDQI